jgi:hypothetical protein
VIFLEHPDGSSGFERTMDDANTRSVVRRTLCFLQQHLDVEHTQCGAGDGGPATAAFLDRPMSLALDRQGNLYVSEQHAHRVRRVDAQSGVITTVVGTGGAGSTGDGGPATRAQVNYPKVAIDAADNIYIGEVDGYRIRRIDARTGSSPQWPERVCRASAAMAVLQHLRRLLGRSDSRSIATRISTSPIPR